MNLDLNPYEITPKMRAWRVDQKVTSVVLMDPMSFLKLTTQDQSGIDSIMREAFPLDKYNKFALEGETSIPPYFNIYLDGNIAGHEGRHRAAALIINHENIMPVSIILFNQSGRADRNFSFWDLPWIWKNQYGYDFRFHMKNLLGVLETTVQEYHLGKPNESLSREQIWELFSEDPVEKEILGKLGMNPENPEWLEYLDPPAKGVLLKNNKFFGWRVDPGRHRPHHDAVGEFHWGPEDIQAKITYRAKHDIQIHLLESGDPCDPRIQSLLDKCIGYDSYTKIFVYTKDHEFEGDIQKYFRLCGKILGENPQEKNPFDPFPAEKLQIEELLKSNWENIADRLNQESWGSQDLMPVCLQEIKTKQETLFGEEEQSVDCEKLSEVLGPCGHYGCVWSTNRPGIVFKVTTDQTEALFIALLKYLEENKNFKIPPGITNYLGVFKLKGRYETYETRPVYCLWRQEAFDVGEDLDIDGNVKSIKWEFPLAQKFSQDFDYSSFHRIVFDMLTNLNTWRSYGYQVMVRLRELRKELGKTKYYEWLDESFEDTVEDSDNQLGWEMREARAAAERLTVNPFGNLVGEALLSFYEQKILVVDIHAGNLGHVQDRKGLPVITDPGFAILLTSEYRDIQVPLI
jgi:hypothetical protein